MSQAELTTARTAAQAGAKVLQTYYRSGVTMRTKAGPNDLVSDADLNAERAIAEVIHRHHPDHQILGEEIHQASVESEHLWIIDPLDGTTNFAHGIPHFAVSIAYYRSGQPHSAVVVNPVRDEWFTASQGQGAFFDGQPIRVAEADSLDQTLVGFGFYYDRGAIMQATLQTVSEIFARNVRGVRRFGTASLDLCQVAVGRYGAFFEYQLSAWDFAAGRLIVEEAGGRVTDCLGNPPPIAKSSVLATNMTLHPMMLDLVARHFPPTS